MVPRYFQFANLSLLQKRISGSQLLVGLYSNRQLIRTGNYGNWQHTYGNGQGLHLGLDPLRSNCDLVEVPNVVPSVGWWTIARNEFIKKI